MKSVMPDCVMPYVIHLLAYMPFYVKYDDVSQLEVVKGLQINMTYNMVNGILI
jgi:hypothetical protein